MNNQNYKNMKGLFLILCNIVFSSFIYAQVSIGKNEVDGSSTILDFISGTTNGIILSAINSSPATASNGTFIFDKTDKKIKVRSNDVWKDLSDIGDATETINTIDNTALEIGTGVIIGANSSTKEGVLVLEATDKAVILPKIYRPDLNVKNPYPGMMCYDTQSNTLAVFDGVNWNYWK